MHTKPFAAAAFIAIAALTLTACGDSDDSMPGMSGMDSSTGAESTDSNVGFNDSDVTFASEMIPHHRQAVEMAVLAETRAKSSDVKELAAAIKDAQDPEIRTMSGWLTSWGEPVPEDMSGMDMSSSMPGMMSSDDMDKLSRAIADEFDQMFLTMMIEHHEGAIEMAKTEQADGTSPDAVALAKQIETAQTDEITTMKGLLG
ncbi:lipoprotein [Nocardioidaceae bacterium Broad-1]|nr:lipoprotein [Nocardioidaceae bacterium Broad-1]